MLFHTQFWDEEGVAESMERTTEREMEIERSPAIVVPDLYRIASIAWRQERALLHPSA